MLFEPHHHGKLISEQLSDYLRNFTTTQDRAVIADKMNVSTSIIRDVVFRTRTLTENNAPAIVELMRVAIYNSTQNIHKAKEAKKYLQKQLPVEVA